jgi:hypothetical protein
MKLQKRLFEVHLPLEQVPLRKVRFAVELLDAVTLSRVKDGVKVIAEGIQGGPIVSSGGVFVWLKDHVGDLQRITIDPRVLPYEDATLMPSDLKDPLTTIELSPTTSYPFAFGITGLRGRLIESRSVSSQGPKPVQNAAVHLRWPDSDGVWQEGPTISHTDENGAFAAILRLAADQSPNLDKGDTVTVRVTAGRDQGIPRSSTDLKLVQGRIADPATFAGGRNALTFAWDELQP